MAAIRSLAYRRQQQLGLRAARKGVPAYLRELREARPVRSPSPALLRAALCTADGRNALGVKKRQAMRSGRLGPLAIQLCWLIHTETWAGSRAWCTAVARSSRTESRSTVSFRLAANAAMVWSVSYRARLN